MSPDLIPIYSPTIKKWGYAKLQLAPTCTTKSRVKMEWMVTQCGAFNDKGGVYFNYLCVLDGEIEGVKWVKDIIALLDECHPNWDHNYTEHKITLPGAMHLAIGYHFDDAENFFGNKADVSVGNEDGTINRQGRYVVPLHYVYYPTHPTQGCFIAGTKISTSLGNTAIETLKIGDEVLSYDTKDNTIKPSKISKVFKYKNKKYGELTLSNGTKFQVTKEHPFYVVDKKDYVTAGKLKPNDKLILHNGDKIEVATVASYVKSVGRADVYNIEVDTFHNYFADKVLVHNKL